MQLHATNSSETRDIELDTGVCRRNKEMTDTEILLWVAEGSLD